LMERLGIPLGRFDEPEYAVYRFGDG
jgi:hypothetical protein